MNFRTAIFPVWLLALAGSAGSFSGQYLLGLNPCVMCIEQRLAMLAALLVSTLLLILPPRCRRVQLLSGLITALPAAFGLYVAVKQSHLQTLPIGAQPSCGAPWAFRLRDWPLFDWFEPVIRGDGACGEVYTMLGIPLPWLGAALFSLMLAALAFGLLRGKKR